MSSYHSALQNEDLLHRAEEAAHDRPIKAERTDNQLVDLVLAGDQFAFEELFERYKRLVAVVASRYFRRPEEIEEIIQVAFAKAFSELASFQGRFDRSFSSWLVRIAVNSCFDVLRGQRRRPERLACDLSEAESDALLQLTADTSLAPERHLVHRDLADKVLAMIPADDRLLLQMLYAEEMSTADIGKQLGLSRTNVKVRAWRARASVRRLLKKLL